LTVLSAALFQKPAFKNVIVNGIILAENGQKMSKSLKNYPNPNDLIDRTGADAIRLFLINSAAVKADDLKFTEVGVVEIVRSVMIPLWSVMTLFTTYANADASKGQLEWTPGEKLDSENELDKWVLAQLQTLLAQIQEEMEAFRLYNVVPAVITFIDDLTNWYVRRSRRRFWKSENDQDKNYAYATLYEVLVTFSKVLAPFLPFLSEEIHQMLVREMVEGSPESVHHCEFPTVNPAYQDQELVDKMAMVRDVVNMGRAVRAKQQIKNRQPLQKITVICRDAGKLSLLEQAKDLILDELNIYEIEFSKDESSLVELSAKANFKTLGKRMGKTMKLVAGAIGKFTPEQVNDLQEGGSIEIPEGLIAGEDIIVQRDVKEGVAVEADESFTVALDITITPELERACIARELINRIQNRRKELDLEVTDIVEVSIEVNNEIFSQAVSEYTDHVSGETLASSLSLVEVTGESVVDIEINEIQAKMLVKKA
ncbi:MAG: DUF5915 domain-containing protein, partial [Fibrobacterales bacterium]